MTRLLWLGSLVIVGIVILCMAILTVAIVLITYVAIYVECTARYINHTLWRIVHHGITRI
jgi:hypothetical protein